MVFSFMLLMTTEERRSAVDGQTGPKSQRVSGRSSLTAVPFGKLGRLIKKDNQIYLAFGKALYHPQNDIHLMEKDQRISTVSRADGQDQKMLYLEEDRGQRVLLAEYLNAFQYLSRKGIGVAFAERVR